VRQGDWMSGRRLEELDLRREGLIVLGVYRRHGGYLGVPAGPTRVEPGDRLVVYGEDDRVLGLAERPSGDEGDRAHAAAVRVYAGQRERATDDGT
jgi:Trk K+ transport system NAD-binding subunit